MLNRQLAGCELQWPVFIIQPPTFNNCLAPLHALQSLGMAGCDEDAPLASSSCAPIAASPASVGLVSEVRWSSRTSNQHTCMHVQKQRID